MYQRKFVRPRSVATEPSVAVAGPARATGTPVLKFLLGLLSDMTDDGLEAAVERFVDDAESAYEEYEKGYADADAVLRLIQSHLDQLERELD